jgi:hypothetical protein
MKVELGDPNINPRKNLKAGAGVMYMEGNTYVDKGPNYIYSDFDKESVCLSLQEY